MSLQVNGNDRIHYIGYDGASAGGALAILLSVVFDSFASRQYLVSTSLNDTNNRDILWLDFNGDLRLNYTGTGDISFRAFSVSGLQTGVPYFIVARHTGIGTAGDQISLSINNVARSPVATGNMTTPRATDQNKVQLAASPQIADREFSGQLGFIQILHRIPTAAEELAVWRNPGLVLAGAQFNAPCVDDFDDRAIPSSALVSGDPVLSAVNRTRPQPVASSTGRANLGANAVQALL